MLAKPSASLLGCAWLAFWLSLRTRDPAAASRGVRPALATLVLGAAIGSASRLLHDTAFGRAESDWTLATPFEVLGHQLTHVVWPRTLLVMYPSPLDAPSVAYRVLGLLALAALAAAFVRVRRRPPMVLVLSLAVFVYLPTSNLVPFARVMSDSYMYLPLSMLLVGAALAFPVRLPGVRTPARTALLVGVYALACVLAASARAQVERYRGGEQLFAPVLHAHPRFARAYLFLGDEQLFRGHAGRAVDSYRRGFRLRYDPDRLLEYGTLLGVAGRLQDAECVLIEAVAYGDDPGYARYNLAALLAMHADYAPRYPQLSERMLAEVNALRRAGRLRFPRALVPGLLAQLSRARGKPRTVSWPRRNCAALAAR